MEILTNQLRWNGGKLQQLIIFDREDLMLLNHPLTHVDADVFREEPNHTVGEWLEKECIHEWRNVPVVVA